MSALAKIGLALTLISTVLGSYYWVWKNGREFERGVIAQNDNERLIRSTEVMADAFTHTNKLLQDLNDGSPDNQNLVSPGLALTLDGMSERRKANGPTNTTPRNK